MQGIVDQMRRLSEEPDENVREKKAHRADRRFRNEIIGLAGNELLNTFSRQLSLHVNMTLMHEKTYRSLASEWPDMHAEVLSGIQNDPHRAAELLHEHFARATALWKMNGASETGAGRHLTSPPLGGPPRGQRTEGAPVSLLSFPGPSRAGGSSR